MKYKLCLITFVALVTAQGTQDDTPFEIHEEDAHSTSILYSVPAPSAGYPEPSSNIIIIPSALPSEFTSDDSCSTALTTITTTRTVSVVTQIPSSLLTVTGIVELSSFMPSQPASSAATVIVPGSSAADEESSVVPPQVPYPTASSKPVSTTTVASTSSTSTPGLPEFTDAAEAMKVPVVVAGLLGWAALVL